MVSTLQLKQTNPDTNLNYLTQPRKLVSSYPRHEIWLSERARPWNHLRPLVTGYLIDNFIADRARFSAAANQIIVSARTRTLFCYFSRAISRRTEISLFRRSPTSRRGIRWRGSVLTLSDRIKVEQHINHYLGSSAAFW